MNQVRPRMTHLFEQLGLDASEDAIALFIVTRHTQALLNIEMNLTIICFGIGVEI